MNERIEYKVRAVFNSRPSLIRAWSSENSWAEKFDDCVWDCYFPMTSQFEAIALDLADAIEVYAVHVVCRRLELDFKDNTSCTVPVAVRKLQILREAFLSAHKALAELDQ